MGCNQTKEAKLEITPPAQRHCTDPIFFIGFIALWIAIFVILGQSIQKGADPDLLIHGYDYQGNICGKSGAVKDKELSAWPLVQYFDVRVCASDCSITLTFDPPYQSDQFLYYCLPTIDLNDTIIRLNGDVDNSEDDSSRAFGDMWISWPLILASAFVAVGFSFFYTWLLKRFGKCMVWTILFLLSLAGFLTGFALLAGAANATEESTSGETTHRQSAMKGMGWTIITLTIIFLVVIFALRKRITMAIEVMHEAAATLLELPALVFFPLAPFLAGMGYIAIWITISIYIFSVSNRTYQEMPDEFAVIFPGVDSYVSYEWNRDLKRSFAIHFFHLLWNVEFWIYFTYCVLAGSVAEWYFTPRQSPDGPKLAAERRPILQVAKTVCRFHLGTLCCGALIIATINFLRFMIRRMEAARFMKPGKCQQILLCCVKCCLKCAECCLDKINKNAFVWTAIYGDNFITAACSSFALIWRNLSRVAAIAIVGETLLFIGKFVVALLTTGAMALAIQAVYGDEISSLALPSMIIFILSFLVACLYLVVFETTIDTIFLCFLIDEEANKGTGQVLSSKTFVDLIDKHAELNHQHAERRRGIVGTAPPSDGHTKATTGVTGAPPSDGNFSHIQ